MKIYNIYVKRMMDIIISLSALLVLSPLLLFLSILGLFAMRGNPFFTQERSGKDEKVFKLIKYRTMNNERDSEGNLLPDVVRLNKYGRFLRSTSLDELPQLINILKGDMSIIGPRPLLLRDVAYMNDRQHKRHQVRPGLTGLAQCNGRNQLNWDTKLEKDVEYVEKISFILDCEIFIKTVYKVFKREGVSFEMNTDMDLKDWNELKTLHQQEEK